MRINVDGQRVEMLAVDMEDHVVTMIDQRWLPFKFELKRLSSWQDTVKAIKDLVTRGAGSVGVAGAFAMAQAAHEIDTNLVLEFNHLLNEAAEIIRKARPTAVNLSAAVEFCLQVAEAEATVGEKQARITQAARQILDSDMQASRAMGKAGITLLQPQSRILTQCNTGGL